uniref:Ubiquitin-like domain-containing protein n=1 Tax=Alexandrium monilatum TaxID=311494 RepID=A0A7S4VAE0_9DINO
MKVAVKCASGLYDLEMADTDTVGELLKKAMENHTCPPWADGVELKLEGQAEDLAEDGTKTLASVGIFGGATVKMAYYQDVLPADAKKLKLSGITPGTAGPFLAGKA